MQQDNVPAKIGMLELLRGSIGAQFVIPAYQRNYTWTANKEVKQLFEDIFAVLSGERSKHFIGIMIYLEKNINFSFRERSVIDGQQRLTTIFLTLYAIKDYLKEIGCERDADALERQYLINEYDDSNRFKLKPLVSDDEVYQHIVKNDISNIIDKTSNVYLNFIYIKNLIKSLVKQYTINDILMAMNRLYIVCVPIGDDDYPQKVFESINATGAKLTASDLIRNFILMPIPSNQQDEYYEIYWKRLEYYISNDSKKLEAFFRFFVMAKSQMLINKNAVYRSFTSWFDEAKNSLGVEGVFKEILEYGIIYNKIYKAPIHTIEKELQKPLEEFRFILSDMPAPVLMELFAIHNKLNENGLPLISTRQLCVIIEVLTIYLMRRALCGFDTSDISRYFPTLLKETLATCKDDFSLVEKIFIKHLINDNKGTAREMPNDNTIEQRITSANMYTIKDTVSIFFRKLELEDNPAPVDFSKLSIEHLMPQTPTTEWLSVLNIDRETYDSNLHRLGNLTFAARTDNSRMSNRVWDYKTRILSNTQHLKINIDILQNEGWNIDNIDSRTKRLISDITRLYPNKELKLEDLIEISTFESAQDDVLFEDSMEVSENKAEIAVSKEKQIQPKATSSDYFTTFDAEGLIMRKVVGYSVFCNGAVVPIENHKAMLKAFGRSLMLGVGEDITIEFLGKTYDVNLIMPKMKDREGRVMQILWHNSEFCEAVQRAFPEQFSFLVSEKRRGIRVPKLPAHLALVFALYATDTKGVVRVEIKKAY